MGKNVITNKCKVVCTLAVMSFLLVACANSSLKYNGSRVANEDLMFLEYTIFNGTYTQEMELEAGDVLECTIVSTAGKLALSVQQDEKEAIYTGNKIPTSDFTLNINESGTYTITAVGKKSEGSVTIQKK